MELTIIHRAGAEQDPRFRAVHALLNGIGEVTRWSLPLGTDDEQRAAALGWKAGPGAVLLLWELDVMAVALQGSTRSRIVLVADDRLARASDRTLVSLQGIRLLSFARQTHERLVALGLDSHYFQWLPAPLRADAVLDVGGERSAFASVSAEAHATLKRLCEQCRILEVANLHIEARADEAHLAALQTRLARYADASLRTHVHAAPQSGATNDALIQRCSFYLVGDGVASASDSFLRALGAGRITVVPDQSPHGDYVGHLSSGLVHPVGQPLALPSIDQRALRQLSRGAAAKAVRIHSRWQSDQQRLVSLLTFDGRRWSSRDPGAAFQTLIRREAARAIRGAVGTGKLKAERL